MATVNGEEVSQQDMEIAVERSRRLLIAQNVPQQDIDEDSLREDVLDSLITREVLKQAASDMDLYFGDAALDLKAGRIGLAMKDGVVVEIRPADA